MNGSGGYAFYVDSSSCSGCKACQVACKDKNGLENGLLWRRVYEISGGGWEKVGEAWVSNVLAYHLSIACNHCQRPACVEACPSGAMQQHPDGRVDIDSQMCLGCGYCAWACPYGAPQYDEAHGVMTKCNLCPDLLEQGLPPACVAACPLRALDFGTEEELLAKYGPGDTPYPLPDPALTQPALVVKAHPDAGKVRGNLQGVDRPRVANREEVRQ